VKRASVTEAKNRLSALLDRVRQGETVIIEDHGIAVAQLVPVAGRRTGDDDDRLTRLERQGILRPPQSVKPGPRVRSRPREAGTRVALSQLVRAERREGW